MDTTVDRLWKYVAKTEGCWNWVGRRRVNGYGLLSRGKRGAGNVLAHRLSWEIHFGTIPDGVWVLHHCDNKACVRPEHLYLGDNSRNQQDALARGQRTRGEATNRNKLTNDVVRHIREWSATRPLAYSRAARGSEHSFKAKAAQLGVSEPLVRQVARGLRWAHVQ